MGIYMANIIKDINSIEIETLNNIKSSKSENTIRAYKSDFQDFVNFCSSNNFKSFCRRLILYANTSKPENIEC